MKTLVYSAFADNYLVYFPLLWKEMVLKYEVSLCYKKISKIANLERGSNRLM